MGRALGAAAMAIESPPRLESSVQEESRRSHRENGVPATSEVRSSRSFLLQRVPGTQWAHGWVTVDACADLRGRPGDAPAADGVLYGTRDRPRRRCEHGVLGGS